MNEDLNIDSQIYTKGKNNQAILILNGFAISIDHTDLLFDYFSRKGFTVARPILPGHNGNMEDFKKFGPVDWLAEAKKWLLKLSQEVDEIYIVGISFGSNLAVSLGIENHPKVKGIVVSEMPIFFSLRMAFISHFIQPLFQLLRIDFIKKKGPLYRKNSIDRLGAFAYVPVRVAGEIRNYAKKRTKKELKKLTLPIFILYAAKSDMVNNCRTTNFICDKIQGKSELYCVPINNHDLNILDDENKIIMLDKIYQFIVSLSSSHGNSNIY